MVNFIFKNPAHIVNLNEMRLSGKLCDVTVKVGIKEFNAHKVILAANLKYFQSMFLNGFQESKQDVIAMKDVAGNDLEAIVVYAYTGELLLTKSNALGLLEIANYLGEDAIRQACADYLQEHLEASDAFRAYKLADAVECASLKNAAKSKIRSNFEVSSQSTEYLDLDFETLKDVVNGIRIKQQILFEGIMKWIMHDPKDRRIHVNDLLCLVNTTKLAAGYLLTYLGSMADHSNDDHEIIKNIKSYHYRCKIQQMRSLMKKSAEVLLLLGVLDDDKRFFQTYNFMEKKWSALRKIPNNSGEIRSNGVILRDRLYYIGCKSSEYTMEVFDPTINHTTILNSSYDILPDSALCACNKFLFLCGRDDGSVYAESQVSRYDPQTNSQIALAPMGTGRYGAGAIFYQGHLHVLGGFDGDSIVNSVEKYDCDADNWTESPSMIVPRVWHAVAVLDGELYACGGHSRNGKSNKVEVYDPANNSWQLVAPMNENRESFLVVAHAGKLWAIGGDRETTVEVYDPSEDQWQMDDKMSSGLRVPYPAGGLISRSCIIKRRRKTL